MSDLAARARALGRDGVIAPWNREQQTSVCGYLEALADLCDTYREALEATANELDRWGWGDMHYGSVVRNGTIQEERVVEAVARARVALATGEQAREAEEQQ